MKTGGLGENTLYVTPSAHNMERKDLEMPPRRATILTVPVAAAAPPNFSKMKGVVFSPFLSPTMKHKQTFPECFVEMNILVPSNTAALRLHSGLKPHLSLPGIFSYALFPKDKLWHLKVSPDQLFFLHRCSRTQLPLAQEMNVLCLCVGLETPHRWRKLR